MWLFTRYGFYSIACASKSDGSLDTETLTVRGRCRSHLECLQKRFTPLAGLEIVLLHNRDYRYRLFVAKEVWTSIAAQLAEEQTWSNFKNEADRFQGSAGADYMHMLHKVWSLMYGLQRKV
jgi:hypothetical protein